ncbi:MAG: HAD hydrolase-like protein [Phycisphaerales bacterium]
MIHRRTLVLFDIDGTLLDTLGAGIEAVRRAGVELYGEHFDESRTEYAGRLDPVIFRDLLRAHEVDHGPEDVDRFRGRYAAHLPGAIDGRAGACAGAPDLVDALEREAHATLGLLTGNFPETGAIKLRCCGFEPARFPVHVWSTDAPGPEPRRTDMPPVGIERWRAMHQGETPDDPLRVVIVGDTPEDVACAKAHGLRCLGVATRRFTCDDLMDCGADRAVGTLEDVPSLVRWIMS